MLDRKCQHVFKVFRTKLRTTICLRLHMNAGSRPRVTASEPNADPASGVLGCSRNAVHYFVRDTGSTSRSSICKACLLSRDPNVKCRRRISQTRSSWSKIKRHLQQARWCHADRLDVTSTSTNQESSIDPLRVSGVLRRRRRARLHIESLEKTEDKLLWGLPWGSLNPKPQTLNPKP